MNSQKLSSFDLFTLSMVIDGAFIYDVAPDAAKMQDALAKIEQSYPILTGRFNPETKSIDYNPGTSGVLQLQTVDLSNYSKADLMGKREKAWSLVPALDIKNFKKGTGPAFSAILGSLSDASILYVQVAHAIMDAHCFYTFLRQWAALYKGEEIVPLVPNQSLLPAKDAFTKEETIAQVLSLSWPVIGFKKMLKMIWYFGVNSFIKSTYVIEVGWDRIRQIKEQSGAGTHAVLSAITAHALMEKNKKIKSLKLLSVANLRGHFVGIDSSFLGNFSQPIMAKGEYFLGDDVASTAAQMETGFKSVLNSGAPEQMVRLSVCASHYALPFYQCDASEMNCKTPSILYVNNQLKFRPAEIDWGFGPAVYAFPNALNDMVKFWQATPGGPVSIIFGGITSKIMA